MSTCSNCFNNCADITSDKCVKYTGASITALEITTGDTLYSVEQKLTAYILTALDGTGINITIDPAYLCSAVTDYLGSGTSLVDIVTSLTQAICDLQGQIINNTDAIVILNDDYTTGCLNGVAANSDTHLIVQAIITKLCGIVDDVTALTVDLATNYVSISDLNTLIQSYLNGISSGNTMKDKMVPYVAEEYYGPLTYFDITGAGTGDWSEVYLCNGQNGTPDKRGRVAVGTTSGMGGGVFDAEVDPSISGNPTYALYTTEGENNITLSEAQMPSHSHATSVVITDPGHFHYEFNDTVTTGSVTISASTFPIRANNAGTDDSYNIRGDANEPVLGKSSSEVTGITTTVTNPTTGSSESHSNIQPVIAAHFIMHIPI